MVRMFSAYSAVLINVQVQVQIQVQAEADYQGATGARTPAPKALEGPTQVLKRKIYLKI